MAGCAYMLPATRVTHPRELHAERSPPADDVIAPAGPRPLAEFFKLGICDGLLLHQDTDGTHRERCAIAFVWKKIINNTGSQGRTAELLNHVLFF